MKKFPGGVLACALLLYATTAGAENTTAFGAIDCGQWIKSPRQADKAWLLGYLSGLNAMWQGDTKNIPRDPLDALSSADQAFLWMDNFCRASPLKKVDSGAIALFFELVAKR